MPTIAAIARLPAVRGLWHAYDPAVWDRWTAATMTALAFVPPMDSIAAEFGSLPVRHAEPLMIVLILAQTLPLAVRSRWPAVCLAVVGVSFAVYEGIGLPPEFGDVTVYLALYSVGAHRQRFRRVIAIGASAAFVVLAVVVWLRGSPDRPVNFLIFYVVLATFWLLGAFVRQRRVDEAERRRLTATAATAAERARIARELHDVVTHHVTAMVVQADAAQILAGLQEQQRVVETLTVMGSTGRSALAELRSLLDVLEATGESAELRMLVQRGAPVERTVGELVERTRLSGQPVEFVEDGVRPELPVGAGLAVYRVVQEGLTNAMKYAAGQPTTVRIAYQDGEVAIDVTNCAAPPLSSATAGGEPTGQPSGGRGLSGLRERVGMLGGELTAGRQPDGRFRLRATIPATEEG